MTTTEIRLQAKIDYLESLNKRQAEYITEWQEVADKKDEVIKAYQTILNSK